MILFRSLWEQLTIFSIGACDKSKVVSTLLSIHIICNESFSPRLMDFNLLSLPTRVVSELICEAFSDDRLLFSHHKVFSEVAAAVSVDI